MTGRQIQSGLYKTGSFGLSRPGDRGDEVHRYWFCGGRAVCNGIVQAWPHAHLSRAEALACPRPTQTASLRPGDPFREGTRG